MSRRKKIPDLSDQKDRMVHIDPQKFAEAIAPIFLREDRLAVFAEEMNVEIDELARDIAAIKTVRETRKTNPKTKYDSDISKAGKDLIERIEKAPGIISRYFRFTDLLEQLYCIDEWLFEARADPDLAGLAEQDPYLMKERRQRLSFIVDSHSIYKRYTKRRDWANKNHSRDPSVSGINRCSNPFFRLMCLCLSRKVLGKPLSQSSIEKDILEAKKIARTQKS
jgi:hypothetical protein